MNRNGTRDMDRTCPIPVGILLGREHLDWKPFIIMETNCCTVGDEIVLLSTSMTFLVQPLHNA
jgi:hypothetical protein